MQQDFGSKATFNLVSKLPKNVQDNIPLDNSISRSNISNQISENIGKIISKSSSSQSLKGFFTGGPFKSIKYATNKILKNVKGRFI